MITVKQIHVAYYKAYNSYKCVYPHSPSVIFMPVEWWAALVADTMLIEDDKLKYNKELKYRGLSVRRTIDGDSLQLV